MVTYVPYTMRATDPIDPILAPEAKLWLAVVRHAIMDLQAGAFASDAPGPEWKHARYLAARFDAAHAWIFGPGEAEDFAEVCWKAGLDPDWVRGLARQALDRIAPTVVADDDVERGGSARDA